MALYGFRPWIPGEPTSSLSRNFWFDSSILLYLLSPDTGRVVISTFLEQSILVWFDIGKMTGSSSDAGRVSIFPDRRFLVWFDRSYCPWILGESASSWSINLRYGLIEVFNDGYSYRSSPDTGRVVHQHLPGAEIFGLV